MSLRTRSAILICCLIILSVASATFVVATNARRALLEQTESDGRVLVQQFVQALASGKQLRDGAEASIGDYMVIHARTVAHLVSIAEAAGLSPDVINNHLRDIAGDSPLEFWITDEKGHAYLRNRPEDFTFNADGPSRDFLPLLTGEQHVVIQKVQPRPSDQQFFKYVGVTGIDKPRIVQIGYQSKIIELLQQPVWISQLAQTWLNPGNVNAVWVFDSSSKQLAYGTLPGAKVAPTATDMASVEAAINGKQMLSYLDGDTLKVVAPATDTAGQVGGAILAYNIPTDRVEAIMTSARQQGAVLLVVVVLVGIIASLSLTRRVTQPAAKLAQAARTIEAGNAFDPDSLNDLTARPDELGQLARVFQTMAREVYAREQALKQQVQELKIEIDEARRARQVAEVTETDYFQELQKKAREIREKSEKSGA